MAQDNLIEGEVWRQIVSYDGIFKDYYHVSNCCRVKSLDRWVKHWRGGKSLKRGRILTPLNAGNYLFVALQANGETEYAYIHQLVADAFPEICGLPFPGSELDHKNGNPHDNRPENLEYKTHKENCNNPVTKERRSEIMKEVANRPEVKEKISERMKEKMKEKWRCPFTREKMIKALNRPDVRYKRSKAMRNYEKYSKPVMQYTKDGQFIAEYPSTHEAERKTGIDHSNISSCCRGRLKSAGGFIWRFK